ncbi:MAG: RNA 2',3'-cyclic phosphodiesterase [Gammaproteobacteria bacterium]|nr:RNA 2',3'-cyclic phosphodiesterase [Gammaproteobacteria bacterium]MBU1656120.1 RNA 2',3'-cyclic phosphodiesterase [Gammaproteobacteria bacterium]MBU1960514.1 RNA 2',3'-cyclic phosphodiesterase [Gammaproteobacteria bacterium]
MSRRLFFGLKPDEKVRNAIDRAARSQPDFKGRPSHPEDLHMTLIFLGQVDGRLDPVLEAASQVRVPPFSLTLDRFGFWPRSGLLFMRPSVVPIHLRMLEDSLGRRLESCGLIPDGREYKPHVTLARKARPVAAEVLSKPIEWQLDRFCLFVSNPTQEPPYYRIINHWPLSPPLEKG